MNPVPRRPGGLTDAEEHAEFEDATTPNRHSSVLRR
jgi:hypothetical protein